MLYQSTQQRFRQLAQRAGDRLVVDSNIGFDLTSMGILAENPMGHWSLPEEGNLNPDFQQPYFNEFYEIQPFEPIKAAISFCLDSYLNLISGKLRFKF